MLLHRYGPPTSHLLSVLCVGAVATTIFSVVDSGRKWLDGWRQVGVSRAVWKATQPAATASKAVVRPHSHADWACSAASGGGGDKARQDWCAVWFANLAEHGLFSRADFFVLLVGWLGSVGCTGGSSGWKFAFRMTKNGLEGGQGGQSGC